MTKNSNQHLAGVYLNIHTKYEVSIIIHVCGQESKSKKSTKIAVI